MRRCPDIKKARLHLEFEPKIKLEEGIHRFLNWSLASHNPGFLQD